MKRMVTPGESIVTQKRSCNHTHHHTDNGCYQAPNPDNLHEMGNLLLVVLIIKRRHMFDGTERDS